MYSRVHRNQLQGQGNLYIFILILKSSGDWPIAISVLPLLRWRIPIYIHRTPNFHQAHHKINLSQ